jgi:hypothetical protein
MTNDKRWEEMAYCVSLQRLSSGDSHAEHSAGREEQEMAGPKRTWA